MWLANAISYGTSAHLADDLVGSSHITVPSTPCSSGFALSFGAHGADLEMF